MEVADTTSEYEVGFLVVKVVDGADMRAVHDTERKVVQQVAICVNVELFGEDVGLAWSHPFQVRDIGVEYGAAMIDGLCRFDG